MKNLSAVLDGMTDLKIYTGNLLRQKYFMYSEYASNLKSSMRGLKHKYENKSYRSQVSRGYNEDIE